MIMWFSLGVLNLTEAYFYYVSDSVIIKGDSFTNIAIPSHTFANDMNVGVGAKNRLLIYSEIFSWLSFIKSHVE